MFNSIVPIAYQIGMVYGSGCVNTLVGAGGAAQYVRPMRQRGQEIERLQKILNFVEKQLNVQKVEAMPHPEELGSILIKSDSSNDLSSVNGEQEDAASRENSSLVGNTSFLVDECGKETDPIAGWIKSLKKGNAVSTKNMDTLTKTKYCMTLHLFSKFIRKRLKRENTLQIIDHANRASFAAQALSGAGQIASATSRLGGASMAVINASSGFSLLSTLFFLGASLRGIYSFSRELSENVRMQKVLQAKIEELGGPKPNVRAGSPDKGILDEFVTSESVRLNYELDVLKSEQALLTQSRNSHIINAVAGLMCLSATILFIVGTQGIGLGAIIAYYALVGTGTLLPFVALAYKSYATDEAKHIVTLSKLVDQRQPRLPDLTQVRNEGTTKWMKEIMKNNFKPVGVKETEDVEWMQDLIEQIGQNVQFDKQDILQFFQKMQEMPLQEEINSLRYANGISEIYYK